uniref:Uncharacterized protein n=1 Tax=Arion vulgaris TaxID=1028688 RepID=A0A0B7AKL6_9EUPU
MGIASTESVNQQLTLWCRSYQFCGKLRQEMVNVFIQVVTCSLRNVTFITARLKNSSKFFCLFQCHVQVFFEVLLSTSWSFPASNSRNHVFHYCFLQTTRLMRLKQFII